MGIFLNTTGDMRISNVATAMSSVKNTMVSAGLVAGTFGKGGRRSCGTS
jgi:flagellar basal body P-ring protein FlgI